MADNIDGAVIFDVDGPLLELTTAEEDVFFKPFQDLYGLGDLSRDWDSYRIRNDMEIYREILQAHLGRAPRDHELKRLAAYYFVALAEAYETGRAAVVEIPGARDLVNRLGALKGIALGTATANFGEAARIRLEQVGLWHSLKAYPGAAESGGAKRDVLAWVIAQLDVPTERIVFLGDNLNDLDAGTANGVHFIGFHVEASRRRRLTDAGAKLAAGTHGESWRLIAEILGIA